MQTGDREKSNAASSSPAENAKKSLKSASVEESLAGTRVNAKLVQDASLEAV